MILVWFCGLIGLILPFWIVGYLLYHGFHVLTASFLFDRPRGFPLGSSGGIFPAIQGSFSLILIGLLIALPAGVGGAIYLAEFLKNQRFKRTARWMVESMAAIPSILYGLFGYAFFVVMLSMGISLLAGGLVLAMVMFPIILITSHEALEAVPSEYREAAFALGVDQTEWVLKVLLRKTWSRILAGIVLAVGHAVGSASPVLFTASVYYTPGGFNLFHPVMTLPTHLYYLVAEAISFDQAYGTALILVLGLFFFNLSAMILRRYFKEI